MSDCISICYPSYLCKQCSKCKIFVGNSTNYKDKNYRIVDYSILIGFSKKCKFMKGEKKNE